MAVNKECDARKLIPVTKAAEYHTI